jgi:hypothetical protein
MKKVLITLTFGLLIFNLAGAQDYKTGVGLRAGIYNGLTVKHFIKTRAALEGLLYTPLNRSGIEITGLYEVHNNAFDVDRLNWYFGAGGHIGMYGDAALGLDLILGIEYNIKEIPINIGIDWKPGINLIGDSSHWAEGGALSIRYIW